MNKMITAAAIAALLAACSAEVPGNIEESGEKVHLSFTASLPMSKVSFDSGGKSQWNSGDAINIFWAGQNKEFTTKDNGGTATFTGVLDETVSSSDYWGLYPYREDASFSDGFVTTVLPSSQKAVAGNYSDNIKIASSSTTDLVFQNVCGALKFRLERKDIRKVTIQSASGTPVAGKIRIGLMGGEPQVTSVVEASDRIEFEPASGTLIAGEWYYIAVLPGVVDDFTISFRTVDKTGTFNLSSYNFKRNKNKVLDCPDRSASWTDSPLFIWEADDVLNASIAAGTIPGAVLSVIKGGQTVYMKAYGNKSVTPSVVPMTLDVVFDMASVTKSVSTTISMMQLVEKGLVDVKATIGTYLSEFDPAEDITVENLLAHNSGFPNYQGYIKAADYAGRPDLLVAYIADSHPRLSKIYRYSCLNFFLCQQIIERVTGQRLCDYAKEHIFQPLGLDDTMYLPAGEEIPEAYKARIAPQLSGSSVRIGKCIDDVAWTVCGGNAGNAGLFTTVADMSVLAKALLAGGQLGGVRVLQPETVRLMATPVAFGRTLGWDNSSTASGVKGNRLSDNLICHTGYSGTFILVDFGNDLAIILFANRCHPSDTGYAALKTDRAKVSNAVAAALLK